MADLAKVAVVGAGLIGRSWAIVFARAGHEVALFDADAEVLAQARGRIEHSLRDLRTFKLIKKVKPILRRVCVTARLGDALSGAKHAQESIFEELEAKRAIFGEMDALAAGDCVLASSSSYIPASRITENLRGRVRCLIAHPANPPHVIPIVEIVPAAWTDADTVARTRALFAAAGQVPIVVRRELDGFVLNRLQAALLNEAARLVEAGYVDAHDLDKTISAGLGRRWAFMGPFETIDLNAPGGVADYARRYGPSMYEMARQQADPRPWSDALVAQIDAERRKVLPLSQHRARQEWRDRNLMRISQAINDRDER